MGVLIIITLLFFVAYWPLHWSATPELRRMIGPGFVVNYLGPLYLSIIFPHAPFFQFVLLGLFLVTTRDRQDAACRFVLLALLMPGVTWRISLGGSYLGDITTIPVLAIALFIKCVSKPDRDAAPIRGVTVEDVFVIAFYLITWIGGGRLPSVSEVLRGGVDQAMVLIVPYFALRQSIRSSEEFMRVITCIAVACGILSLFAVYEAANGWTLFGAYRGVSDVAGINRSLVSRGGAMRAAVTMSGALMLSVVLLMGFIATFYSRRYVRKTWMLTGWGTVIFLGIVMTQSRGNLALLPVAVGIFAVLRRRWGLVAGIGIGGPAVLGLLYALSSVSPKIAAFLHVGEGAQNSGLGAEVYDYRQLLLSRGMEVAASHRLTGAALKNVVQQMSDITQGQGIVDLVNTYLTIYLVSGLMGFVTFMVLLAMIWSKIISARISRLGVSELVDLRAFAITVLALVVFQLAFMSFIDRLPLCMALALVGIRVVGAERRRLVRERKAAADKAAFDALPLSPAQQAKRRGTRARPNAPAPLHG